MLMCSGPGPGRRCPGHAGVDFRNNMYEVAIQRHLLLVHSRHSQRELDGEIVQPYLEGLTEDDRSQNEMCLPSCHYVFPETGLILGLLVSADMERF